MVVVVVDQPVSGNRIRVPERAKQRVFSAHYKLRI